MGCTGSSATAKAIDSTPPVPSKAKVLPLRDFHAEYVLGEKLGQGSDAVVYATTHAGTGAEELAVKVIDLRDARSDFDKPTMRLDRRRQRSVANEVSKLRMVRGHDHICRIFEHFVHEGLAYVVFDRYGRTLCEGLESCAALNEETIRPFFRGMLTGIEALHAKRIVHCDVKPDNFMCSGPENIVKLCDFGRACTLIRQDAKCMDLTGVDGSAIAMAPEVLQNEGYGAKADVWSFGVIAHVLLYGRFPDMLDMMTGTSSKAAIPRNSPTPMELFGAGEQHRRSGGMSEEARIFIARVLARSTKKRPRSREALRDDFFTSLSLSQVCLRHELEAAKRCGAFDDTNARKAEVGDIDLRLKQLQARRLLASDASTDIGSTPGECGDLQVDDGQKMADATRQVPCDNDIVTQPVA